MNDTNREELIDQLKHIAAVFVGLVSESANQAADMLKADAERIAGYKEDQRELMSQMQEMQQEINDLKAKQVHILESNAREIESIECDYTDQVLLAVEAEEKLLQQVALSKRKPIPESEIYEILNRYYRLPGPVEFVRAIEDYHGIKGEYS